MKVILIKWNSYGNETMQSLMERKNYEVIVCPFDAKKTGEQLDKEKANLEAVFSANVDADYVFSFNYSPIISNACQEKNIKYISWVYDSPFMNIYSFTVPNPVNRIFVFDYALFQEFEQAGIDTVFYMPLGVDEDYLEKRCGKIDEIFGGTHAEKFDSDISLVGSLYTEKQHRLYDKFDGISPYAKGYLDALVESQKHIYGEFILERLLPDQIEEEMQLFYPCDPNPTTVMTPKQIYSQFVLARQVTSIERREILEMLGKIELPDSKLSGGNGKIVRSLYTNDSSVKIQGWNNMGPVDYYEKMPLVFRDSKINLNITLRSIKTGIPLRIFDIMGAGGFVLTNYQAELLEYFTPGEDLVIYEDYEDLKNKVEYYLTHEDERRKIAENGCRKVRNEHTFAKRLELMESTLV